ncbi:hypothetical protein LOC68_01400 [Blastopirellula sp. JC732]|uniref:Uncharacterized protein n=1 Tax=Blastopirellula sediminis TaxID=2894196 RepID=A0A9X1MIU1_9BACT|nr:hypothetical protein [Blastopirellula sediminis]MCC9608157.1 hypothetical protein [Blastopirellula sediminis]MCC9627050.1 hypothetical protein [Blastopirellula sediminis]
MVKNLVCGAIVACLLAVNVASAQSCGCSAPEPSCGCSSCQHHTCCDPCCCNPLGTALKNLGCGIKTGLCHIKGGVERLLCPIRYNGCCHSCGGCGSSVGCGDCVSCGAGVPPVSHYGSPMIEDAPVWNGKGAPTPPTPHVDEPTSVVPEPARFQPPGSWKSAQVGDVKPAGKQNLYYSKVIAEKSGVSRVSHTTKSGVYFAAPKSK